MHFCPSGAADLLGPPASAFTLTVCSVYAEELGLPPQHTTFKLTLCPVCAEELGLDRRQQQPGPAPGLLGVRLADADLRTWQAGGEYVK